MKQEVGGQMNARHMLRLRRADTFWPRILMDILFHFLSWIGELVALAFGQTVSKGMSCPVYRCSTAYIMSRTLTSLLLTRATSSSLNYTYWFLFCNFTRVTAGLTAVAQPPSPISKTNNFTPFPA